MQAPNLLEQEMLETNYDSFENNALKLFRHQFENNAFYQKYCSQIKRTPQNVKTIEDIPFLPIQFFKTNEIKTGDFEAEAIFESSGTTHEQCSKHFVKSADFYQQNFFKCFEQFYGRADGYCIVGLLPSYLEKGNSSLVFMVNELIKQSTNADSGFFNNEFERLKALLEKNEAEKKKTIIFGVTFALLDFAELSPMDLKSTIIIETGGMKGRREELTKEEVHEKLKEAFKINFIHSEYGMTELMSQAYSYGQGIFSCPQWMQILLRKEDDPFSVSSHKTMQGFKSKGVINIIDLGNVHSCAFIATDDLGELLVDGRFKVLGRLDNSDIRGCSQLTA